MKSRVRTGFTLIELLVVIAIIAILAAILFPVFATAREKARQISCVSNQKSLGMATLQYSQDYNEQFMLRAPIAAWEYTWMPTPGGQWPNAAQAAQFSSAWAGAIQPYAKSWQIYQCPTAVGLEVTGYGNIMTPPKFGFNMAFNALLGAYSHAGVASPARCILFWEVWGNNAVINSTLAAPPIVTPDPRNPAIFPVRYTPISGNACGTRALMWARTPNERVIHHSGGQVYTYADGHSKWVRSNAPFDAGGAWASVNANGSWASYWWNGCVPAAFAPDRQ